MRFWDAAKYQAGREFGARYWRWFVAVRVLRAIAPGLAVIAIGVGVLTAYRWLSPNWAALGGAVGDAGSTVVGWLPAIGTAAVWTVGAVIVVAVVACVAVWVRARWWRWSMLYRPMWIRRY